MQQNLLNIFMLAPRGFCAGVERAILTVEEALNKFGPPIYVKHQIVHNRNIIEHFTKLGVIFTNNLEDIPDNSVIIFNAHGVTQDFENTVKAKKLTYIDATCPLVKKVHREAVKHQNNNKIIIIIGHKDHPEVIATNSRVIGCPIIIENISDAENFSPDPKKKYAFITQTTLSVDFINKIVNILTNKIPDLTHSKNICYATQNRQNAIKEVIKFIDTLIIVGSENSSNSNRLKEIGEKHNIASYLIDDVKNIPMDKLKTSKNIAISAGASSPDYIVNEILNNITNNIKSKIIPFVVLEENIKFTTPKIIKNI